MLGRTRPEKLGHGGARGEADTSPGTELAHAQGSVPACAPRSVMFAALSAWCGSVPWSGGLLLGLFIAGAGGSAMHCVPMCGGFVLGQVADRMVRLPTARLCEWRRFEHGALLPYHLGRLTTYAILGALGSGAAGALPWFPL